MINLIIMILGDPDMAKKIACLLAFLTIFTGCSGIRYSVSYDRKEDYSRAKDTYPAGKKVTLYYNLIGTDTDYSFYLDGERLNTTYRMVISRPPSRWRT